MELPQVKLQIRIKAQCLAFNLLDENDTRTLYPSGCYQEASFTVDDSDNDRALFLVGDDHVARLLYGTISSFKLLFEAEPFFEIMKKFSEKDRLVFFKHAELPDLFQAMKFLDLVGNSDLSEKDNNRAFAWVMKLARRQSLVL